MPTQFTADELDILRHLIEPKKIMAVIYSVLDERHNFPEWVHKALEHGWEPPHRWLKAERDVLHSTVTRMIDRGYMTPGVNWELKLHKRLQNEMTMLALQAQEPRPDDDAPRRR